MPAPSPSYLGPNGERRAFQRTVLLTNLPAPALLNPDTADRPVVIIPRGLWAPLTDTDVDLARAGVIAGRGWTCDKGRRRETELVPERARSTAKEWGYCGPVSVCSTTTLHTYAKRPGDGESLRVGRAVFVHPASVPTDDTHSTRGAVTLRHHHLAILLVRPALDGRSASTCVGGLSHKLRLCVK